MSIQRILHLAMILSLALVAFSIQPAEAQDSLPISNTAPPEQSPEQPPIDLSSLLQPDGTLNVPQGMEGSYRVEGWQMALDGEGQPHFTPSGAELSAVNSDDQFWNPGFLLGVEDINYEIGTSVQAIAIHNELVYVGGDFTQVGSVKAHNIACWDIIKYEWRALGIGTDDAVNAIGVYEDYVYAGGDFAHAGGLDTGPIARWDVTSQSWSSIGAITMSGWQPRVFAMAIALNGDVYLGGYFDHVNNLAAGNIAHLSGTTWDNMDGGVYGGNPPPARVLALAFGTYGGLYVGGGFTVAGGDNVNNLAFYDGSWHPAAGGGVGPEDAVVSALTTNEGDIYVGGNFTIAYDGHGGMLPVNNVARWMGTSWNNMAGGVTSGDYDIVSSLVNHSSTICAGGRFDHAGGIPANNVACWNGASWITLREPHDLVQGVDNVVKVLADNSDFLFLGGLFHNAGNYAANHITAFQFVTESWNGLGSSVNRTVNALTIFDGYVYVGGSFTSASGLHNGSVYQAYLARWNIKSNHWFIVDDGVSPISGCTGFLCTPMVNSIFIYGNDVYVGGNFTRVGGLTVNGIARFSYDDYDWHTLGSGAGCASCTRIVRAITRFNEDIYIGGRFDTAGGVTVNNVAYWDGIKWNSLSDFTYNGTNGPVYALKPVIDVFNGDYLLVGGDFTTPYEGHPYLAGWNGANWFSKGSSLNGPVYSIIGGVYQPFYILPIHIGGGFSSPNHIARLSGSTWVDLGAGLDDTVRALAFDGEGGLYAGGDFNYSSLYTLTHIAHWNGDTWQPIGSGVDDAVNALAVTGSRLFAGGDFIKAGGKPSFFMASWDKSLVFMPVITK